MEFDLEYARNVIEVEADAIISVKPIVDASFARACRMIYECSGSCIISGSGNAGIIGQKLIDGICCTCVHQLLLILEWTLLGQIMSR